MSKIYKPNQKNQSLQTYQISTQSSYLIPIITPEHKFANIKDNIIILFYNFNVSQIHYDFFQYNCDFSSPQKNCQQQIQYQLYQKQNEYYYIQIIQLRFYHPKKCTLTSDKNQKLSQRLQIYIINLYNGLLYRLLLFQFLPNFCQIVLRRSVSMFNKLKNTLVVIILSNYINQKYLTKMPVRSIKIGYCVIVKRLVFEILSKYLISYVNISKPLNRVLALLFQQRTDPFIQYSSNKLRRQISATGQCVDATKNQGWWRNP
eukprot:TRINITY_DN2727_c2_g1_i3.p2 TRINITY_DN2727_c2_g1~~TRINITY_DN2727_c2_g1_i3.p2  ORF type:complete len:260 (+),score=-5.46 TRINITY_DN2727_c2_g1_i3:567-1346(+)